MTTTPANPSDTTGNPSRRHGHIALVAAVALSFGANACGSSDANEQPSTTLAGSSNDHDSRING